MGAKEVIRSTLGLSDRILQKYLGDLSDEDLKVVPLDGMNPIAWQVGHLLTTENQLVAAIRPGHGPKFPDDFPALYGKGPASPEAAEKYLTKQQYLDYFAQQRAATLQLLDELDDAELGGPSPEAIRGLIPTLEGAMNFLGTHVLMHAGQWVAVRRKLGKPIAI